jgi:Spy/CpxP family protein refolding chaperone
MLRLREQTRKQIDSVLTAEQRTKLQQRRERQGPPPRDGEGGFGGPRRGPGGPPPRDR